jgi:hypothetical protein
MEIACRIAAHIPAFYQQDVPVPAPAVGVQAHLSTHVRANVSTS